MATVEEALVTLFKNEPTISTILGSPQFRYTPDAIPQGTTLPAVAYQRISVGRQNSLATIGSLARERLQLTIWANSVASRALLRSAFISFLRAANLQWRDGTRNRVIDGIRFGGILIDNDIEQREPDSNVYQSLVDLIIWYNEVAA